MLSKSSPNRPNRPNRPNHPNRPEIVLQRSRPFLPSFLSFFLSFFFVKIHSARTKSMSFPSLITPGCSCSRHRNCYIDWPLHNSVIRVSSCMRVCPYCGRNHRDAGRLRKHLKTSKYRKRNIQVETEHPGAEGVRYELLRSKYSRI